MSAMNPFMFKVKLTVQFNCINCTVVKVKVRVKIKAKVLARIKVTAKVKVIMKKDKIMVMHRTWSRSRSCARSGSGQGQSHGRIKATVKVDEMMNSIFKTILTKSKRMNPQK